MIPGIDINLGGRQFTVPPLNFKKLREFKDRLAQIPAQSDPTRFEYMLEVSVPVIHAALVRNYPELKAEELEELLDLGNFRPCLEAVMGASGLRRVPAGESSPVPASAPTSSGPTSSV